jgi:hypothetical protein
MVASEEQKFAYDKGRREVRYDIGDLVLNRTHFLSSAIHRFSAKLAPKHAGPFIVLEYQPPGTYLLGDVDTGEAIGYFPVHFLKKYVEAAKPDLNPGLNLKSTGEVPDNTVQSKSLLRPTAEMPKLLSSKASGESNTVGKPKQPPTDRPPPVNMHQHVNTQPATFRRRGRPRKSNLPDGPPVVPHQASYGSHSPPRYDLRQRPRHLSGN